MLKAEPEPYELRSVIRATFLFKWAVISASILSIQFISQSPIHESSYV